VIFASGVLGALVPMDRVAVMEDCPAVVDNR
jgi:hypothetical protein